MTATRPFAVCLAVVTLAGFGCADHSDHATGSSGAGSDASSKGRIIEVDMTDNAFAPTTIRVAKGETVTFAFRNRGNDVHEAMIGSMAEQKEHGVAMQDASGSMDHSEHGGDGTVSVPAGADGTLTHRFTEAGTTYLGCHRPGHFEAGMQAAIKVT